MSWQYPIWTPHKYGAMAMTIPRPWGGLKKKNKKKQGLRFHTRCVWWCKLHAEFCRIMGGQLWKRLIHSTVFMRSPLKWFRTILYRRQITVESNCIPTVNPPICVCHVATFIKVEVENDKISGHSCPGCNRWQRCAAAHLKDVEGLICWFHHFRGTPISEHHWEEDCIFCGKSINIQWDIIGFKRKDASLLI